MNKFVRLSLVACAALSLGLGFAAGTNAMPGEKVNGATLQDLQQSSTPEVAAAEQRIEQAKAQVDLANKQVNASRALLKAAQADLKAALSEVQALKLSVAAQSLVQQTGMTPAKAAPVAIASKVVESKDTTNTAPLTIPAPAPTPGDTQHPNTTPATDTPVEPIQLR